MKASKMIAKNRARRQALAIARDTRDAQVEIAYRESCTPVRHQSKTRNYTLREREEEQQKYTNESFNIAVQQNATARNLRGKFGGDIEGKQSIGL